MTKTQRLADKPIPRASTTSRPFWDGCAAKELRLPTCRNCSSVHFYPRMFCPSCGGDAFDWIRASGEGTVFSTTVVHRSFWGDAWADDVPYNVALITLTEGVQMVSNVVGIAPDQVVIGMPVEVDFEQRGDVVLPVFKPIPSKPGRATKNPMALPGDQ